MSTLSEEQLKRIEENRAAALLRRQQALQKQQASTSKSTENNAEKKHCRDSPAKDKFEYKKTATLITAVFKLFKENRFIVDVPHHEECVNIFKTIQGKVYENDLKKWSFPLTQHSTLVRRLKKIPELVINAIPYSVVKTILEDDASESDEIDLNKIDATLRSHLMPFQLEGIKFGIRKKGKCLIADDMGLGKTIQALGIAYYFKENWPLLIVCPSLMRLPWKEAIKNFLPSVKDNNVQVLTSGKDPVFERDIVITSYDLMKTCCDSLKSRQFGCIIFDESHSIKNYKSYRTKVALKLARSAKNVLLLSGTPALSKSEELYPQIQAVDPSAFDRFFEFGLRYCDGKEDKYGWNFSGSSNLEELELFMKKKIMIRRLKSDVMKELPAKIRRVIILHPSMLQTATNQMDQFETDYSKQKGTEKHKTLMLHYSFTGERKLNAVCEYIEQKLEKVNKFLVFAHHTNVINGICDLLKRKTVAFIRIDGSDFDDTRKTCCDRFQNTESCRVAVLSLKAAPFGITLTAAQLVIFAELYWNPGDLMQAEDRAHRIGQRENVVIEYLIAKGTADEQLWKLIKVKLDILNKIGLGFESFKEVEIQHLKRPGQGKKTQAKITSFLTSKSAGPNKDISNLPSCSADSGMDISNLPSCSADSGMDISNLPSCSADSGMDISNLPSCSADLKTDLRILDDLFNSEADDDLLSKIDLEKIEEEYYFSNKKMKTA